VGAVSRKWGDSIHGGARRLVPGSEQYRPGPDGDGVRDAGLTTRTGRWVAQPRGVPAMRRGGVECQRDGHASAACPTTGDRVCIAGEQALCAFSANTSAGQRVLGGAARRLRQALWKSCEPDRCGLRFPCPGADGYPVEGRDGVSPDAVPAHGKHVNLTLGVRDGVRGARDGT
jgi:hypothetical protein